MKLHCKIALAALATVSLLSACSPDEVAITASSAVTAARVAHAVKSDSTNGQATKPEDQGKATPANNVSDHSVAGVLGIHPSNTAVIAPGQPITIQCTSAEDCQKKVDSMKKTQSDAERALYLKLKQKYEPTRN